MPAAGDAARCYPAGIASGSHTRTVDFRCGPRRIVLFECRTSSLPCNNTTSHESLLCWAGLLATAGRAEVAGVSCVSSSLAAIMPRQHGIERQQEGHNLQMLRSCRLLGHRQTSGRGAVDVAGPCARGRARWRKGQELGAKARVTGASQRGVGQVAGMTGKACRSSQPRTFIIMATNSS